MRHTTALLAVLLLGGAAACSSGGESDPAPTVTVTAPASPTLDAAAARQACVDAWLKVMTADGYDPDAEPATPSECEGLSGQAGLYMEALQARNAENRASLDACLEDPSCTSWPLPTP